MDSYLSTAIIASIFGTVSLTVALMYLRSLSDAPAGLGWWVLGLGLTAGRLLLFLGSPPLGASITGFFAETLQSTAEVLLIGGTARFLGRHVRISVVIAVIATITVWVATTVFMAKGFMLRTLPLYGLTGAAMIYTGSIFMRGTKGRTRAGYEIGGFAFILWGLHKLHYPFTDLIQWFSPWGVLVPHGLALSVAVGLLVAAQQRLLERTETSERKARESEKRLANIIANSPFPIVISGVKNGRVLFANQRAAELLEVPPTRRRVNILNHVVNGAQYEQLMADVLQNGSIKDIEVELRTSSETRVWTLLSARLLTFGGKDAIFIAFSDITERKAANDRLHEMATRDQLTKLLNRTYFFHCGEVEFNRTCRYGGSLSAIMFDVDHFKKINDTYGHATGDEALRTIGATCHTVLRDIDIVGRYGGEEFAVLLPQTNLSDAHAAAERLRFAIEGMRITVGESILSLTISAGVVDMHMGTDSLDTMLGQADAAMYQAKRGGRNRVIVAGSPVMPLALKN